MSECDLSHEPEEVDTQTQLECSGCYADIDVCDNCKEGFYGEKVVHLDVSEWDAKHFCSMDCAEEWKKEKQEGVGDIQ